eukprot:TRINITY_DN43844_c0_g1_i1.p1 TRINITY_DN43844_c0_g1~~TRINITY_DN43844_c0_g1_i1.p1  ORF type:complete len:194 (+),score=20.65 TRINITY_DN43844_c0_g1_i1:24-584(+)
MSHAWPSNDAPLHSLRLSRLSSDSWEHSQLSRLPSGSWDSPPQSQGYAPAAAPVASYAWQPSWLPPAVPSLGAPWQLSGLPLLGSSAADPNLLRRSLARGGSVPPGRASSLTVPCNRAREGAEGRAWLSPSLLPGPGLEAAQGAEADHLGQAVAEFTRLRCGTGRDAFHGRMQPPFGKQHQCKIRL